VSRAAALIFIDGRYRGRYLQTLRAGSSAAVFTTTDKPTRAARLPLPLAHHAALTLHRFGHTTIEIIIPCPAT